MNTMKDALKRVGSYVLTNHARKCSIEDKIRQVEKAAERYGIRM